VLKVLGTLPETLEATESVGPLPCNALSMPEEAAVVAIVCECCVRSHRSKVEAPTVGWAKEAVWEVQTVSPLPETEGMDPVRSGTSCWLSHLEYVLWDTPSLFGGRDGAWCRLVQDAMARVARVLEMLQVNELTQQKTRSRKTYRRTVLSLSLTGVV